MGLRRFIHLFNPFSFLLRCVIPQPLAVAVMKRQLMFLPRERPFAVLCVQFCTPATVFRISLKRRRRL